MVADPLLRELLPQYRSHKIVRAAKITVVTVTDGRVRLEFAEPALHGVDAFLDQTFLTKHFPQAGGYFVLYDDGYESYSPAAPFEAGYTAIGVGPRADEAAIEDIARVCHEANRAYCLGQGDLTQVGWDQAPTWQRESAVIGVRRALEGATPEELHESWLEHKIAEGWIWGPVKDAERRQHPCVVPYAQLPPAQRRKDALFGAIVAALR